MNVLVVTPYYEPNIVGGAEISTQLLAESMAMIGHKVHVLTVGEENRIENKNNVIIHYLNLMEMIDIWRTVLDGKKQTVIMRVKGVIFTNIVFNKLLKQYTQFIKDNNIDIAVINSNAECFCRASLWKSFAVANTPVILTVRDPILLEKKVFGIDISRLYRGVVTRQMKWISAYAAPSEYMLSLYEKEGFYFKKKRVIYNAVDVKQVYKANKCKRIVYAGGLVEKKGIRTLLAAFDALNDEHAQLVFIGRGEMADELTRHSNVKVISWMTRQELYKYMQESWLVVLPSEWPEAFGRVLVESVFNGTLAIGSSAGGIPEIFGEDKKYVFEERNLVELSEKLRMFLRISPEAYEKEILYLQKKWSVFTKDNYSLEWNDYINDVYIDYEKTLKNDQFEKKHSN